MRKTASYTTEGERRAAIAVNEGRGLRLLHDDHTPRGGALVFTDEAEAEPEVEPESAEVARIRELGELTTLTAAQVRELVRLLARRV